MFEDRKGAGQKLGRALKEYKGKGAVVLAIPKGGVEVGYEVAKYLEAEFLIAIARKLPFPDDPEAGFGAIAEDGSSFIFESAAQSVSRRDIERIQEEQRSEIERRIKVLRNGRPLPGLKGRVVIAVDDGLAMGSTMRTVIMLCRKAQAQKVIVAIPVAGADVADAIGELADELVVLETPAYFRAVAQVYRNWYDVSDEEVIGILARWRSRRPEKLPRRQKGTVEI